jgi:hypothetical protein
MIDKFKDLLHRGKDASASAILEKMIRERLANYGRISNFTLDSRQKKVRLEMLLHGETEPLNIVIEDYAIVETGGSANFVIRRASASRPWVQRVIDDFLIGRPFLIPEKYSALAKMVIG